MPCSPGPNAMTLLQLTRAWAIIAVAMIANGIFRELVIRPRVGAFGAELVSVALGIALIVTLTSVLLRRLAGRSASQLIVASLTLVSLTVAFEFLFGHYVDGKSWAELVENYAFWRGHLWPIALLCVALMPFLWGRWQRAHVPRTKD
jgi:hypothetical protein